MTTLKEFEEVRRISSDNGQFVLNSGRQVAKRLGHRKFDTIHVAFVYLRLAQRFKYAIELTDRHYVDTDLSAFLASYTPLAIGSGFECTEAMLRALKIAGDTARKRGPTSLVTDKDIYDAMKASKGVALDRYETHLRKRQLQRT